MAPRKFTRPNPNPNPLNPVPIPDSLLTLIHESLKESNPVIDDPRSAPPLAPIASMVAVRTLDCSTQQDTASTNTTRSEGALASRMAPSGKDSYETDVSPYPAMQEALEAFERLTPADPPSQYLRVFARWSGVFPPPMMDPEQLLAWCQLWSYNPEVVTRWLALAEWVTTDHGSVQQSSIS